MLFADQPSPGLWFLCLSGGGRGSFISGKLLSRLVKLSSLCGLDIENMLVSFILANCVTPVTLQSIGKGW